jgi:glycosyltransferase involved in cell wall biosynthesis
VSLINGIDFEYRIAGTGSEEEKLQTASNHLGIGSRVKFLGFVADMLPVWEDADIFLMPSLWEGFGLAAVEAMNASLPLVVSDVPGLREIIDTSRECAIVVDPLSSRSIAEALIRLLESDDLRSTLGLQAFNAAGRFEENHMVDAYFDLYCELTDCL